MYIITDVNIDCFSVKSNCYKDNIQESKTLFLENISEHCYNYYRIRLNLNMSDIFSQNIYIINDDFYLEKKNIEEDLTEVFLYKKTIKKGFMFNTSEFIVSSIFQLKFELDSRCSVKTMEYVKIT